MMKSIDYLIKSTDYLTHQVKTLNHQLGTPPIPPQSEDHKPTLKNQHIPGLAIPLLSPQQLITKIPHPKATALLVANQNDHCPQHKGCPLPLWSEKLSPYVENRTWYSMIHQLFVPIIITFPQMINQPHSTFMHTMLTLSCKTLLNWMYPLPQPTLIHLTMLNTLNPLNHPKPLVFPKPNEICSSFITILATLVSVSFKTELALDNLNYPSPLPNVRHQFALHASMALSRNAHMHHPHMH